MKNLSWVQWVQWIGATLVATVSGMVFLFTTFDTKAGTKEFKDEIMRRLERIEDKIDSIKKVKSR